MYTQMKSRQSSMDTPRSAAHSLQFHVTSCSPSSAIACDLFLPEILDQLASFLVGFDVLQLSHVSSTFRAAFSKPHVWRLRAQLPHPGALRRAQFKQWAWCAEQAYYFSLRSLQFRGLVSLPESRRRHRDNLVAKFMHHNKKKIPSTPMAESVCGDVWELPTRLLPLHGRLSWELWFSLGSPQSRGGILLGVQSQSCLLATGTAPVHHQRFVYVDPDRNLCCSVLPSKPVIAHDLEPQRWYHLALSFNGLRQCVYLDGQLVNSGIGLGNMRDKWHWVPHAQIGTGFVGASSQGKPSPEYAGWYPLEGLVDEFRFWTSALTREEIERLALREAIQDTPTFQLSSDRIHRQVGVRKVKCSRPAEKWAIIHLPRSQSRQTAPSA